MLAQQEMLEKGHKIHNFWATAKYFNIYLLFFLFFFLGGGGESTATPGYYPLNMILVLYQPKWWIYW